MSPSNSKYTSADQTAPLGDLAALTAINSGASQRRRLRLIRAQLRADLIATAAEREGKTSAAHTTKNGEAPNMTLGAVRRRRAEQERLAPPPSVTAETAARIIASTRAAAAASAPPPALSSSRYEHVRTPYKDD